MKNPAGEEQCMDYIKTTLESVRLEEPPAIVIGVTWANGLGLIRSLGEAGVPVLALDSRSEPIGFSSRYVTRALVCPDPEEKAREFLEFMGELGLALEYKGVLFLTRDQDVSVVSQNQELLERHFHIPFAQWTVVSRIVDKQGQYAVARAADVPLPETFFPQNDDELEDAVNKVPYPAIIKPAYHVKFSERFGVKGFVAEDPAAALRAFRRGANYGYQMMLQEIIPGDANRLYTYGSYLDRNGRPLGQFTGRKLRQNPRMFGTCRVGESCPAPDVAALGLRLLHALDYWGISQVEFKLDPRDDQFKLMEVNARSYQWQHLATACGANLALLAYRDALNQCVAPVFADDYGKRWSLIASDLVMTPREIARGQTSLRSWLNGWRGLAVDGIFSFRDPKPGLRYLKNRLVRRLRRRE
jgi:predicted ATP-grasp superfamily ATP-dependent carboligase